MQNLNSLIQLSKRQDDWIKLCQFNCLEGCAKILYQEIKKWLLGQKTTSEIDLNSVICLKLHFFLKGKKEREKERKVDDYNIFLNIYWNFPSQFIPKVINYLYLLDILNKRSTHKIFLSSRFWVNLLFPEILFDHQNRNIKNFPSMIKTYYVSRILFPLHSPNKSIVHFANLSYKLLSSPIYICNFLHFKQICMQKYCLFFNIPVMLVCNRRCYIKKFVVTFYIILFLTI